MITYSANKNEIELAFGDIQEMTIEDKTQYHIQTPLITCTDRTHAEVMYNQINAFVSRLSKDMLNMND